MKKSNQQDRIRNFLRGWSRSKSRIKPRRKSKPLRFRGKFLKRGGYIKDGLAGPSPAYPRGGGVSPAQEPGKGALSSPYPCVATQSWGILEPRLLSEGPDALGEYRVSPSLAPIRRGMISGETGKGDSPNRRGSSSQHLPITTCNNRHVKCEHLFMEARAKERPEMRLDAVPAVRFGLRAR